MTQPDLAEIVCVIDASDSMNRIASYAIEGFNNFLKEQQELPGDALLTLIHFSSEHRLIIDRCFIADVRPLEPASYCLGGMTALYDAVGSAIDTIGKRLAKTPEEKRPGKVIFVILTDGYENSSREYNQRQVFDMITHQREAYGWEFVFLAANQDALMAGGKMGIAKDAAFNFAHTGEGVQDAYTLGSTYTRNVRTGDEKKNTGSTE